MRQHSLSRSACFGAWVALLIVTPTAASDDTALEEQRLELERRELQLKKRELELERKRLEIETAKSRAREIITIQLQGEVLFDFGKAEIRPASGPTLAKIAAVIGQFPEGHVTIAGHTDSVGSAEANLALSKARAAAVRDWLVEEGGLGETTIVVEGYGETRPIAANETPEGEDDLLGRAQNRRVEIRIADVEKRSSQVEAAMRDLGAEETEESLSIDLQGDVLFEFGKATILPEAEKTLRKVAIILEQFPGGRVLIEGHTDSKGPPEANLVLSEQRAEAVKTWLVGETTISSDSIATKGLGETDPVAPNVDADGSDEPEGRKKNRRVEIVVTK